MEGMSPRLAFALQTLEEAGKLTLKFFQKEVAVERKQDSSPVTVADIEAEKYIRSAISSAFPGEAVLGEEGGEEGTGPGRWVIDPIDGTQSFICGVPLYACLLSFEYEGSVQLGVCYFPALNEMLFASAGEGCTWNGRPCRVSSVQHLAEAVVVGASPRGFQRTNRTGGMLKIASQVSATRTWCDAYGHALVATGRADAMLDPRVAHYDISAMSLIVCEAGGKFTRFDGTEVLGEEAISSNGLLHSQVLECF